MLERTASLEQYSSDLMDKLKLKNKYDTMRIDLEDSLKVLKALQKTIIKKYRGD